MIQYTVITNILVFFVYPSDYRWQEAAKNDSSRQPSKENKRQLTTGAANPATYSVGESCWDFCCTVSQKYDDEIPQVARMISIADEEEVTVEWWIGGWSKTWVQWKTKGVPNTEVVHKNSIIMTPIELTNSNRLKKDTVMKLKELYSVILFV